MDHLVIGTAGHVDHGKTELVKALTGHDTDLLKEEKERGMTIELGFAPFMLEDKIVSIVDVPGHEKLIKTMVSGASGIDMALLIIAANEGIMPQTIEHIHILSLLNVTSVIVVITKIDLINENEHNAIKEDIKIYLKDTNLKDVLIHSVSSTQNIGIEELKTKIIEEAKVLKRPKDKVLLRMPIDRVFTMKGHGTIVTGTLLGGKIQLDELIDIVDGDKKLTSRVKNLQVHGEQQKKAFAGQRCAINLNRVEKSLIKRGDVMIKQGTVEPTGWVDTVIYNVGESTPIKHNQRVRINIGTAEIIGKLRIIGQDQINGKKKGYASIKLEKPIIAIREDRFIIRSLTPVTTIGGGIVLNHRSSHLPRFKEESINHYRLLEGNSIKKITEYILNTDRHILDIDMIYSRLYCNKQDIWKSLKELTSEGKVIRLGNYYVSEGNFHNYINRVTKAFQEHYKRNKYSLFMSKEELKSRYFSELDMKEFHELIQVLTKQKIISQQEHQIAMHLEKRINLLSKTRDIMEIEKMILDGGMNCLDQSIIDGLKYTSNDVKGIVRFLEEIQRIRRIDDSLFIHITKYNEFITTINYLFEEKRQLTVIEVRDALKIGRKRTINLLEYLDQQGITKRIDNYRIRSN